MAGEACEMRGSEMKSNEMRNPNGNKHGEKGDRDNRGLTVTIKRITEWLPTDETPPPAWVTDTVVRGVVNNQNTRNSEEALT